MADGIEDDREPLADWSQRLVAAVMGEVERYRKRQGLRGEDLAKRCRDLGYHRLDKSALSKLATGARKSLTVGELLVLAAALRVPPIALLLPLREAEAADLAPDSEDGVVPLDLAYKWLAGDSGWPPQDPSFGDAPDLPVRMDFEELKKHARCVQAIRDRASELDALRARKAVHPEGDYGDVVDFTRRELRAAEVALFQHRQSMQVRGWRVLPRLAPDVAEHAAEGERQDAEWQAATANLRQQISAEAGTDA